MKYPIAIDWGDDSHATGIMIPDLNVATAGDSIEEAFDNALEAAALELENFVNANIAIPMPSDVQSLKTNPDFKDMSLSLLEIDISPYLGKTEKVTITMPSYIVTSIDKHVLTHNLKSRSSFLAEAAIEKLSNPYRMGRQMNSHEVKADIFVIQSAITPEDLPKLQQVIISMGGSGSYRSEQMWGNDCYCFTITQFFPSNKISVETESLNVNANNEIIAQISARFNLQNPSFKVSHDSFAITSALTDKMKFNVTSRPYTG